MTCDLGLQDDSRDGGQTMEAEAFAALKANNGGKALELFEKLAASGSGMASYCVGDIYLHGQGGVKSNIAEARKWYQRALSSSVSIVSQYAAFKLGYIYEAGYDDEGRFGAAIDNMKAFNYYKLLEHSDIAMGAGQLRLGIMYEMGKGTPKDLKKAMELYRRAAHLGHVIATKNLGVLKLKTGHIIPGLLLWASAILEGIFLGIFKRNSPRIKML